MTNKATNTEKLSSWVNSVDLSYDSSEYPLTAQQLLASAARKIN